MQSARWRTPRRRAAGSTLTSRTSPSEPQLPHQPVSAHPSLGLAASALDPFSPSRGTARPCLSGPGWSHGAWRPRGQHTAAGPPSWSEDTPLCGQASLPVSSCTGSHWLLPLGSGTVLPGTWVLTAPRGPAPGSSGWAPAVALPGHRQFCRSLLTHSHAVSRTAAPSCDVPSSSGVLSSPLPPSTRCCLCSDSAFTAALPAGLAISSWVSSSFFLDKNPSSPRTLPPKSTH